MKPKILFIMHLPPPIHGAAMMGQYIHDSEWVNKQYDCCYLNLTIASSLNDIGKAGISKFLRFLKLLWRIIHLICTFQPDIVYVTPNAKGAPFYKEFIIVQLLKCMRCKVVAHYHNKGVQTRQDKILDNLLYKIFFRDLEVILLSEYLYQDIQKYVSRNHVQFCPNGIPDISQYPYKKVEDERLNILFLSNMMKEKGVWDLLDACAILRQESLYFYCHFVGGWKDVQPEDFVRKCDILNIQKSVKAHGPKYKEEKKAFWEDTDIFVFPSLNESFGLVLLEAMQYGIPCIATNEGGIPSIIKDGKTGIIVEKNNPQAIADAIEKLAKSPELRKSMGVAGRERYEKLFTLNVFEKQFVNCMNHFIARYTHG